MITTTLGKINDANEALSRLGNTKLPIKQSYSISKLINLLNVELKNFQLQHKKLLEEFGVKKLVEGNEALICKPENVDVFQKQYKELCDVEVEINYNPVEVKLLEISAIDLIVLEPFIIVNIGELDGCK